MELAVHPAALASVDSPVQLGSGEHAGKHGFNALGGQSEVMVEFGPRVGSILEIAREREIDLIIMGERSSNSKMARVAAHLPGITAYDVISQAHCPVLTVHAAGEAAQ